MLINSPYQLSLYAKQQYEHSAELLILCFTEESHTLFVSMRGGVNNDKMFICSTVSLKKKKVKGEMLCGMQANV